jgi:hypothetical protein
VHIGQVVVFEYVPTVAVGVVLLLAQVPPRAPTLFEYQEQPV